MIRQLRFPVETIDVAALVGLVSVALGVAVTFGIGPALIVVGALLVAIALVVAATRPEVK